MKIIKCKPVQKSNGYRVYVESHCSCGNFNEDMEFGPFPSGRKSALIDLLTVLEEMDTLMPCEYHRANGFDRWFDDGQAWWRDSQICGYYVRYFEDGVEYEVEVEVEEE